MTRNQRKVILGLSSLAVLAGTAWALAAPSAPRPVARHAPAAAVSPSPDHASPAPVAGSSPSPSAPATPCPNNLRITSTEPNADIHINCRATNGPATSATNQATADTNVSVHNSTAQTAQGGSNHSSTTTSINITNN